MCCLWRIGSLFRGHVRQKHRMRIVSGVPAPSQHTRLAWAGHPPGAAAHADYHRGMKCGIPSLARIVVLETLTGTYGETLDIAIQNRSRIASSNIGRRNAGGEQSTHHQQHAERFPRRQRAILQMAGNVRLDAVAQQLGQSPKVSEDACAHIVEVGAHGFLSLLGLAG